MKTKRRKRRPNDWGTMFRNALARGLDHGYAAFLADGWEKRQAKKEKKSCMTQ